MRGPSARAEHCGMGNLSALHGNPDRFPDGTDHQRMEKFMTTVHTPVDNGVNVEALLGVREALADTPEIAAVPMADKGFLGSRHPQPLERGHLLRVRRGTAAQDDVHLRRRPSSRVRRAGQWHHVRSSMCWSPWAAA